MDVQAKSSSSLIWPTALAGLFGSVFLIAAVLSGPADADAPVKPNIATIQAQN
ncbi:MAG: hypothetical protein Q7T86_05560 [Hyphomicrobiaceae bacterium]|nr:hypothetical protein [Hyphomicrobiaceae bacterium]